MYALNFYIKKIILSNVEEVVIIIYKSCHSILVFTGHPNTRLMIYQCGVNGVFEAVYHGVPIICLPVFFDQFDMAQRVASKGIGLRLDLPTLTSQQLLTAIQTVLTEER